MPHVMIVRQIQRQRQIHRQRLIQRQRPGIKTICEGRNEPHTAARERINVDDVSWAKTKTDTIGQDKDKVNVRVKDKDTGEDLTKPKVKRIFECHR